jgi:thiol-disulfide isomerase/thioredoxin
MLSAEPSAENLPTQLNGVPLNPTVATEAKAVVLIFLASDCPISNRYAPLVNRMYETYKTKGIDFFAVYPMNSETVSGIKTHQQDYGYEMPALMDKDHFLVNQTNAMVTPETAVFLPGNPAKGSWIYKGRINDLYVYFGKWRHEPTSNDLSDTLDKILSGEALEPRKTRAIGCYIKE